MRLFHRCTGPSETDPYPCGVWINLRRGWLRIWPLFIIRRKPWSIQFNICLGRWVNAASGKNVLLKLKEVAKG